MLDVSRQLAVPGLLERGLGPSEQQPLMLPDLLSVSHPGIRNPRDVSPSRP